VSTICLAVSVALVLALGGCDKLYRITRTARFDAAPQVGCIENALTEMKASGAIEDWSSETKSFWLVERVPAVSFSQAAEGQGGLEQMFSSIGPTYSDKQLEAVLAAMKDCEQRVIAGCGTRLAEPSLLCDMRTDCRQD
jgi:hypothetical protein